MYYQFTPGGEPKAPVRAYHGDAGWDLFLSRECVAVAGKVTDCATNIRIALPEGFWGRIVGRSSTFRKSGVLVVEGIIDQGYRGELFIGVYNPTKDNILFPKHTRLAQIILHELIQVPWSEVADLPESERGSKGFGSSGR
ncbi:MAG TPA: dUTP diphosphatase [Patescibacteria group bacterium]|nr:dUTP diphosphatase [Patescibacteria group bacterium]